MLLDADRVRLSISSSPAHFTTIKHFSLFFSYFLSQILLWLIKILTLAFFWFIFFLFHPLILNLSSILFKIRVLWTRDCYSWWFLCNVRTAVLWEMSSLIYSQIITLISKLISAAIFYMVYLPYFASPAFRPHLLLERRNFSSLCENYTFNFLSFGGYHNILKSVLIFHDWYLRCANFNSIFLVFHSFCLHRFGGNSWTQLSALWFVL